MRRLHPTRPVPPTRPRGRRDTGPKGRPTPKRNEARRNARKGPVAPAPMTAAEARARRKTLAGPKLSREERRAERTASRARMTDRRERMMAGDEAYLLPRDQGPVRRYVRDVVDSRRNVLGLFMPSTLGLLFIMFGVPQLQLLHVSGDAGADGRDERSTGSSWAAKSASWSTRSSRATPKAVGSWAFTPPAGLPKCAGCGRPGRKSSAAPVSVKASAESRLTRCAPWCSAGSGQASPGGRRKPSPTVTGTRSAGPLPGRRAGRPGRRGVGAADRRASRPSARALVDGRNRRHRQPQLRQSADTPTLVDDLGTWLTSHAGPPPRVGRRIGGGSG